jgi:Uncharacterized flagellar protein FlaG
MKVAEFAQGTSPRGLSEPVRNLSLENRGATASPATMKDAAPFDKDRLKEAMKAAENLSRLSNRRLKFEYHEETDVFQVSVLDEDDEVIRKIPADNVLRMVANIEKMLGLSIDTRA